MSLCTPDTEGTCAECDRSECSESCPQVKRESQAQESDDDR